MGPGQTDGVEKGCNETFPIGRVNGSSVRGKRRLWRAEPQGEVRLPHSWRRALPAGITQVVSDKHSNGLA